MTNGSAGTVTFKSGKIYITWNWVLKDSGNRTVDSGTEKHTH